MANPKKCAIGLEEARYLGYVIGCGVIEPQINNIEAIENKPRPVTTKQARALLGIVGYYWRFIPNFSGKTTPLADLLKEEKKKLVTVQWSPQAEEAYRSVKVALCGQPILISPNFKRDFIV
ncbi:uncharacterized protein [Ranitomeya imitator]|uniref:uncharacterized protein n=1 Tax=Ranitomeya imitator TaxID=111125 RepID=UPI0037E861E3